VLKWLRMNREIARKWYKQAVHDLEMAAKNLQIGGYDVAAFLSHQAVEKLLKAGLALQGREIPRSHYLDELAHELELPKELREEILDLTPDYTLSRYPDVTDLIPYEHYDQQIAKEKVATARKVLEYFETTWEKL